MPAFTTRILPNDSHERAVCDTCGWVSYDNPKVVIGSVVAHGGQVMLCRRAIEPRRGFWTLPAGYLEHGETLAEGAQREASEEAGASILIDGTLAIYSISRIGQVQVLLFGGADIPGNEVAVPAVHGSLHAGPQAGAGPLGAPATNPVSDPRGTSPETPAQAAL